MKIAFFTFLVAGNLIFMGVDFYRGNDLVASVSALAALCCAITVRIEMQKARNIV